MRVVFDSNVWIAAALTAGSAREVVEEAFDICEIFISPYIVQEIDRTLDRKISASKEERVMVRRWLLDACKVVVPAERKDISCSDSKDIPILWLALDAHADLLVTGDHALLAIKEIQGIKIIPPARFWKESSINK